MFLGIFFKVPNCNGEINYINRIVKQPISDFEIPIQFPAIPASEP